jgi:hypothetical protein
MVSYRQQPWRMELLARGSETAATCPPAARAPGSSYNDFALTASALPSTYCGQSNYGEINQILTIYFPVTDG